MIKASVYSNTGIYIHIYYYRATIVREEDLFWVQQLSMEMTPDYDYTGPGPYPSAAQTTSYGL